MQNAEQKSERLRHSLFILASFILYGYETYFAIHILQSPTEVFWGFALADLLIIISAFGIIQAWELLGIRQFHVRNWLASFKPKNKK